MSFSNEIKTILKLEDKDWKKALESINQAEKQYYKESTKNNEILIESKQKLSQIEKRKASELEQINKQLAKAEQNKTKAIEVGDKALEKSFNRRIALYKQQVKEVQASYKIEQNAAKESVSQINNTIYAQEKTKKLLNEASQYYKEYGSIVKKSNEENRESISLYNKNIAKKIALDEEARKKAIQSKITEVNTRHEIINALKEQERQSTQMSLKEISNRHEIINALNKQKSEAIKASMAEINAKHEVISSLTKQKIAETKLRSDVIFSLKSQQEAEKKHIESLKEEFTQTYKNTQQQNQYNTNKLKLKNMLELGAISQADYNKGLDIENKRLIDSNKNQSNLTNSLVRHLRQIETLIVAYYTLSRAWSATLGQGLEVNKIIESNTYGIAALESANTRNVDSLGNTVSPMQKFIMAQKDAKGVLEELRKESVKTYATFPQLIEIFQQATGQTLSMGNAFGMSIEEINKNTILLASRMSNLAGSIGQPMDRVREEIRSLLSANASTDSLISTMLFGSPGQANKAIREAKKSANGLTDLLNKMLEPFDILADTRSYQKGILALQNSWQVAMGDMVQKSGAFEDITNLFYDMSDNITKNTDEIVKDFDRFYKEAKRIADILYEPLGLVAGLWAAQKAVLALNLAIKANPIALLATGTVLASEVVRNYVEQLRLGGKTQEEFNKMVKEGLDKYNSPEEAKKRIEASKSETEQRINGLQKTIQILKDLNKPYEEQQKALVKLRDELEGYKTALEGVNSVVEKNDRLKNIQDQAKLIQKLNINTAIEKDLQKTLAKEEDKATTLIKERKAAYEDLLNMEQQLKKEKQAKNQGEAVALLTEAIEKRRTDLLQLQKTISEEQLKKALEKTKELAKQQEIELRINAIKSGQLETETYGKDLAVQKVKELTNTYNLLKGTKEESQAYLAVLEAQLKVNKLDLQIQEKKNALQVKSIEKQFKRDTNNKDTTLLGVETSAQSTKNQLIDVGVTEAQLAKFEETVKDTVDRVKDNFFENEFDFNIKMNVDYSDSQKAISQISNNILKLQKEQNKWNKYSKQYQGIINRTSATEEDRQKAKKVFNVSEEKHIENQISAYANLAGAVGQMFEQGSREAAAFQAIESGLALVTGIRAILTQGSGDPYTAFARMAAMAATVSSLLSSINVAFGSNTTSVSSDAFSAMAENTGTGTVLGDTSKASESIKNSLSILEDFAQPQFQVLSQMNESLKTIEEKIGGVSSLLIRQGGITSGAGFTPNNYTINPPSVNSLPGYKAMSSFGELVSGTKLMDTLFGTSLGGNAFDLFSGATLTNKILGGLFGKTSVKQTLTDYGINFNNALLTDAIEQINGQAYQTITTKIKKKSWFHSSTKKKVRTYFSGLDDEIERQFSLVLENLYNTTIQAGKALDTSSTDIENSLSNFIVSIGKISTKGKSGEQIQEQITNIFSKISDDIAKTAFPTLVRFQDIGEGLFETLTRVATGMEEAGFYIDRLGNSFEDLKYTDIINAQGNVGFEALYQSIIKTDEAVYGLNNNLIQILTSVSSTAEELYTVYLTLDDLRARLGFLSQDINGLSSSMITGAGGIENLQSGFESYFENFLTEEEQVRYQTQVLRKEFEKIGVAVPESKDAFSDLLDSIDLTTESGQKLYGRIITLSDAYNQVTEAQNNYTDAILEQKRVLDELAESIRQQVYGTTSYDQNKFLSTLNIALSGTVTDEIVSALKDQSSGYLSYIQSTAVNRADYEAQAIRVAKQLNQINDMLNLPSYAVGSTNIPYDMTANIHQGEMILPRTFADGLRSGEVSVGNNYEINKNLGTIAQMQNSILQVLANIYGVNSDMRDKVRDSNNILTDIEEAIA